MFLYILFSDDIIELDFCIYEQVMELMHGWMEKGKKMIPLSIVGIGFCLSEPLSKIFPYFLSPNLFKFTHIKLNLIFTITSVQDILL